MKKRKIVIFSGAGLSAESGVPTFRDSNGLWENHNVEDVASPEGWQRDKELVLKFYEARFKGCQGCEPNAAHKAIAELEQDFEVINFTQNIDDLLERAGATNIRHIHGSILQRKCEHHFGCSVLDGDQNFTCDYLDTHTSPVTLGELCPKCSGQLRPNVVWFGEAVDLPEKEIKELVQDLVENDGIFIVVGTSAQVYPAAFLIHWFHQVPNKYFIDKKPQAIPTWQLLEGKAGEILPVLAQKLKLTL